MGIIFGYVDDGCKVQSEYGEEAAELATIQVANCSAMGKKARTAA
jgi:hypothetical protein